MEKHILTRMGLLNIQVCSSETEGEALAWIRLDSPAGTSGNWGKQTRLAPVQCEKYPDRKHYIFDC